MNSTSRLPAQPDCATNTGISGRMVGTDRPLAPPRIGLKAAVVHDDSAAGQRALNVFNRLERQPFGNMRVHPVLWRFDRLAQMLNRCRAADDLADADVIVLSLTECESVPAWIETWFDSCLKRKRATAALLLLFREEEAWVAVESKSDSDRSVA